MTKEQFKDIKNKLKVWREERHLSYESQRAGLLGNLLEECTEYARAKDDCGRIDALCDIVVFCMNAYEVKYESEEAQDFLAFHLILQDISEYAYQPSESDIKDLVVSAISSIRALGFNPYECMLETIKEIDSRTGKYNEGLKEFIEDSGVYNENELLKEIENFNATHTDRVVTCYSDIITFYLVNVRDEKYFIDDTEFKIAKWYKADYEKCRYSQQLNTIQKKELL